MNLIGGALIAFVGAVMIGGAYWNTLGDIWQEAIAGFGAAPELAVGRLAEALA